MRWRDSPKLHSPQYTKNTPDTIETNPDVQPKHKSSYFTFLLYTGYYTLAVPFKPVIDIKTNQYKLQSNPIQKFFCYITWTLSLINRVTNIRRAAQSTFSARSTIRYFQLTHAFVHLTVYLIYFKTVIFYSNYILQSLNSIHSSTLLPFKKRWSKYILVISQIVWIVFTIGSPIIGYELLHCCCWTPEVFKRALLAHGRFSLFIRSSVNSTVSEYSSEISYTKLDHCVISVQFFGLTAHMCVNYFIIGIFGNTAITLWDNANSFYDSVVTYLEIPVEESDVETNVKDDAVNLKESFDSLRSVASSVNTAWHLICFWYVFDLMAWLSTELDMGLRGWDNYPKVEIFYNLGYIAAAMCLSAEAFRKIEKVKALIRNSENVKLLSSGNGITQDALNADNVLKSLETEVVGIGDVGFFRLNYSFIGQMTRLIITFYMISVGENTMSESNMKTQKVDTCGQCYIL